MISQIIVAFSSLIGKEISVINKKEVKIYDKYISISQYVILLSMIFFVPIAIPLILVLILNIKYNNIKLIEVLSKGGILFFNSQIAILLLLIYQLLEGRRYNFKRILLYDTLTTLVYLILFFASKLF